MIGVDTNIIVRLVVEDDPSQAAAANRLLREIAASEENALIVDPVLCEIVWVLESRYRASRQDVVAVLRDLLANTLFVFEDRAIVQNAVDSYEHGEAGLADLLIGLKARALGARTTFTFDRPLSRLDGFSRLMT